MSFEISNLAVGQTYPLNDIEFSQLKIDDSYCISDLYDDSYFYCAHNVKDQKLIEVTRVLKADCKPIEEEYVKMGCYEVAALALEPKKSKKSSQGIKVANVESVERAVSHNPDFEGRKFWVIKKKLFYLVKLKSKRIRMEDND